jgi:hypothetical protein
MSEETVIISKAEYLGLLRDSNLLSCLEACGVDNWQGWDDAIEMLNENVIAMRMLTLE